MPLDGFRCKNPYRILSTDEIEKNHTGSLDILEETVVNVADARSRQIHEDGGCQVDHDSEWDKFPPQLVQWAIDQCPERITLRARTQGLSVELGGDMMYFASFPGFTWLDVDTQERREARVEDCAMLVKLCDALPMVHTLYQPVAHLGDRPPEVELEWVHATELRHTDKTIMGTEFVGSSKWLVKMSE